MKKIDIGKVVNVRGVHGEMKILPHSNVENLFSKLKELYIGDEVFVIKQAKLVKSCAAVTVEGIDTPEKAKEYVNKIVYALEDALPKTDKDEYYIKDMIGIQVEDIDGNLIGTLTNVFFTGANDVYEITAENGKTVLVPAVKEFIKTVDLINNKITIKLIEGMM